MKVAHLTSVHYVDDGRIYGKECRSLAEVGHEVTIVGCNPAGVRFGDVTVRDLQCGGGRLHRVTVRMAAIWRAAMAADADVYHLHDPELIPLGLLLRRRGKHVIYDAHEDVPRQILAKSWIPGVLRGPVAAVVEATEAYAARRLSRIVVTTPFLGRRFPVDKTVIVCNFPIVDEMLDGSAEPYEKRCNVAAYVGGITRVRGIVEIVRAMELLPESLQPELRIAGEMEDEDLGAELAALDGWNRTAFLGWRTRQQVAALLGQTRVGLCVLHPLVNYKDAYPIKLFEYMIAALPVVVSDFPVWREIVDGAGCGLLVDPLDPAAIADAIRWLFEHPVEAQQMGVRGQRAVLERYNWDSEKRKLLAMYEGL